MGVLYLKTGKPEAARDIYQKLELLVPNNANYLYNYSFILYKLNNFDNALEIINKAIHINNNDPGLHNLKGQILGKKGKISDAIKSFEMSIKLKPNGNSAVENLRILQSKLLVPERI